MSYRNINKNANRNMNKNTNRNMNNKHKKPISKVLAFNKVQELVDRNNATCDSVKSIITNFLNRYTKKTVYKRILQALLEKSADYNYLKDIYVVIFIEYQNQDSRFGCLAYKQLWNFQCPELFDFYAKLFIPFMLPSDKQDPLYGENLEDFFATQKLSEEEKKRRFDVLTCGEDFKVMNRLLNLMGDGAYDELCEKFMTLFNNKNNEFIVRSFEKILIKITKDFPQNIRLYANLVEDIGIFNTEIIEDQCNKFISLIDSIDDKDKIINFFKFMGTLISKNLLDVEFMKTLVDFCLENRYYEYLTIMLNDIYLKLNHDDHEYFDELENILKSMIDKDSTSINITTRIKFLIMDSLDVKKSNFAKSLEEYRDRDSSDINMHTDLKNFAKKAERYYRKSFDTCTTNDSTEINENRSSFKSNRIIRVKETVTVTKRQYKPNTNKSREHHNREQRNGEQRNREQRNGEQRKNNTNTNRYNKTRTTPCRYKTKCIKYLNTRNCTFYHDQREINIMNRMILKKDNSGYYDKKFCISFEKCNRNCCYYYHSQ